MTINKVLALLACVTLLTTQSAQAQQPAVEEFKRAFEARMQQLLPQGFTRRTVSFIQVVPGTPNGGYYPFKVTVYVHDYGPGYPANKYYGQTCLGKMEGLKFDMRKDDFGEWIVQGRFTMTGQERECKANPAEGIEALPLAAVPGKPYVRGATPVAQTTTKEPAASPLYFGEYACYGTGGRLMAGMGFYLLANGRYHDGDKQRGGSYVFDAKTATISFRGGFLDGQKGKNVKQTGFQISNTIYAEPWR